MSLNQTVDDQQHTTRGGARASAVSRVINARVGKRPGRLVRALQAADGSTTVFTMNGGRHQAAVLSAARRALVNAGYVVDTFHGRAGLPLAPHLYYLVVTSDVPAQRG